MLVIKHTQDTCMCVFMFFHISLNFIITVSFIEETECLSNIRITECVRNVRMHALPVHLCVTCAGVIGLLNTF